jgi:aldehyde:ferredoxin oxidoreductase
MALAYSTADRGACHMRSWPLSREALSSDPAANRFGAAGKAAMVVGDQDGIAPKWSMIFCDFVVQPPETAVQMLAAVGLSLTEAEYRAIGPRAWNLIRLINLREGWTAAGDVPPAVLAQPLEDSGWRLPPEVFAQMKAEYYHLRRWDEQGRPTPELLAELGLEGYAARLA